MNPARRGKTNESAEGQAGLARGRCLRSLPSKPGVWMTSKTIYENISTTKDFLFRWNVRSMYVVLGGMYRKHMVIRRQVGNKLEYTLRGGRVMGLYIFESKHAPYIKVGFTSFENPWNRLNGSANLPPGFSSGDTLRAFGAGSMLRTSNCGDGGQISPTSRRRKCTRS